MGVICSKTNNNKSKINNINNNKIIKINKIYKK